MTEFMLDNCQFMLGDYDLSGYGNSLSIDNSVEMLDVTAFNVGYRKRIAGFLEFSGTLNGWLNVGATTFNPDVEIQAQIGAAAQPMSVAFSDGTEGDVAYISNAVYGTYNLGAGVGEAGAFTFDFQGGGASPMLVRGYIMDSGAKTTSGNSTGFQMGAIGAAETMYANIHCTAFNATSIDVKIVSDDNSGFTSATDRITFAQLTGTGSEFKTLAGAITDDYWRVEYTLVGTSATIFVTAGIA